ncbi:MAG: carbon-nitrogen hydrolase family protein [Chloroflexi bacterium]|nr:carbon-nitrogen hydrolase family protein [Chloroflexota bacterium]
MLSLQVGIVTMGATPWELEENFQRMEAYVREAARRRAKIVIAPEAVLDGYVCGADPDTTRERMLEVAQTIPDGPYLRRGAALSKALGIYLIFGFLERDGTEMYNSCALFDPQGQIIARYSKVHPTNESYITPGRELKPFDTPLGRIGMLICSDRGTVDNFAALGVQGTEFILLPMDGSGGPENTQIMRQRARDNNCGIVIANTWSCAIVGSRGEIYLEKYETECVSVGRLYVYDTPKGKERGMFMGRRPDLYQPLTRSAEEFPLFDANGKPTDLEEESRASWRKKLKEIKTNGTSTSS